MSAVFRFFQLLGALLGGAVVSSAAALTAPQSLPAGWTAYHRAGALFVPHPVGWQVQERGDGAFVAFLPGPGGTAQALAYVKPQRFGPQRNAADALGLLPREEAVLFPRLRIVSGAALDPPHVGVRGELRFTVQGQAYGGVAVVRQAGTHGSLFVLSAAETAWPVHARTLADILGGFRYLPAAGARPRSEVIDLQWVPWRDPREGAFTVPVPAGWTVQGGMMRPNLLEWRPEVVATSPDGTVSVRVGDGRIEVFAVPYALPMVGGLPPGTKPSFAGGEFLDYLPGAQFLARYYLPRRFGQMANLQGTDLPEVAQQAFRARPPPAPMQGRADAGVVRFEIAGSSGPLIGQYFVTTHFVAPPAGISGGGAGNWEVGVLSGYLCRADREPLAQRVLAEMSRGLRFDVNWHARQLQIDIGHAQAVVAGNQQLNDIVAQTHQMRASGMEAAQRPAGLAAAGMTEVLDASGKRYQVPITGHQNYYLVHRTGEVVATDADLPPYDFRVLVPTR